MLALLAALPLFTAAAATAAAADAAEPRISAAESQLLAEVTSIAETDLQAAIGRLHRATRGEINPALLYVLGVMHLRNDQAALAEACFGEAVQRHRGFVRAHYSLATALMRQNKHAAAVQQLEIVLQLAPDEDAARLTLAALLLETKQYTSAIAHAQHILANDPQHASARLIKANALLLANQPEDARAQFSILVEHHHDHTQARRNLAALYLDARLWRQAVEHLQILLDQKPDQPQQLRRNLIVALVELNELDTARTHVLTLAEHADADNTDTDAPAMLLAQRYLSAEQAAAARQLLLDTLQRRPQAHDLRELLAALLLEQQQYEAALQQIDILLEHNHDRHQARRLRIDLLLYLDQPESAITELRTLLAHNPDDQAELWTRLGQVLRQVGRDTAAVNAFNHALDFDPGAADAQHALLQTWLENDDYHPARKLLLYQLGRHPQQRELWHQLVNLELRRANHAAACAWLICARQFGIADTQMLLLEADLLLHQNLTADAAARYLQALDNAEPAPVDQLLEAIASFLSLGQADPAQHLLDHLANAAVAPSEPQQRRLSLSQARIAGLRNNPDAALQIYEQLLNASPLDAAVLTEAADLLRRQQRYADALLYYERLGRISPEHQAMALVRQAQIAVARDEFTRAVQLLEQSLALQHREYVARYLAQVRSLARR